MIRPAALYNKARFSRDFASLGRVAAVLCGNVHITREELTDAELSALEEIENENDEMDKAAEERREKVAERQRSSRASRDVTPCHASSRDVTPCHASSRYVTDVTHLPTEQPTELPNNQPTNQTNTNRSDAVLMAKAATGTGRVKLNPYSMGGDEFFSMKWSVLQLCNAALGDGFWAKAIRQLGDAVVLEELWTFISEVKAGESVSNPAAVMTKRLKAKGVK